MSLELNRQHQGADRPSAATPGFQEDERIHVLHVDDDQALLELTSDWFAEEYDMIELQSVTSADAVLETLDDDRVDCVVSDYNMPGTDGLELLEMVREAYPDLPFILFTGRGSEEIASEAISVGVTDYLQKGSGTDQYTVLANRVQNAVSQYRAERAVEEAQDRFRKLIQYSTDVVSIVDADGRFSYVTPSSKRVLGYEPEELVGDVGFDHVHPDDRATAMETFGEAIENPDRIPTLEFRFDHPDGWIWVENLARNMVDDPVIGGFVVHTRDITERIEREQKLERQNERLEEVIDAMSHDLRNPLNVAQGCLDLARDAGDTERLDRVEQAQNRVEQIIDDLVTLAREGEQVEDILPVSFATVCSDAWTTVQTKDATLHCEDDADILADPSRLQRLFENLFRNAVVHGGSSVQVRAELSETGFFVEDDGPGIEADDLDRVFESGYSTSREGTGFGLSIVKEIVAAHGWQITATEGTTGGARIEISGVTFE